MKKTLLTIIGLVILASAVNAQQLVVITNALPAIRVVPETWTGSNAVNVATQLLAITNLDGSAVIPQNFLSGQNSIITISVNYTNNAPSLTACG